MTEAGRLALKQAVRRAAMDLLARRDHSSLELRGKLERRFGSCAEIEQAITELSAEQLQSDRRFVENFIRSRSGRGQGPLRIAAELKHRGIGDELLAELLDYESPRWFFAAQQVRQRRFGAGAPDNMSARQRQARFLQQRGFTGNQVRKALARISDQPAANAGEKCPPAG